MVKLIKKLYQSKEWKIGITEECAIKIWKRQPDKTWRPWMRVFPTPSFMEKNKNVYIVSDDRVTDDDKQTRAFLNASDYVGIQCITKAPVTQRHLDALDAVVLAKNMARKE